ncbi:ABC-type transport system, probable permease component [Thermococcus kodakarensis KOD1]|uniref:ABC-type transport system, probable permease component n=1 Tax=Thermococcus kodakarensis (strain ATCC BAA-918 / JCM 12380 / KOD1) TaxID=69014 RepID=Q5JDQ0_THEKO|nr:ABC transporter permease subunit [Thermococcus kodakarensis]WCN27917.1 ABC transporter permease subunit [Thermococcus kodakarensis]WCN30216.1 ABC transporter permease subunit [Thermococcus kodakarensis]BAD86244.1 ABC-type transport system, probable permease component [Thermococcus kodakarensis KOD1]
MKGAKLMERIGTNHPVIVFLLSLFPAIGVELELYYFSVHNITLPPEKLGYLVTLRLLTEWLPVFLKYLIFPVILILLLSRFGSDFERGNLVLMLSKPLTRRRYFLNWVIEGLKLALASTIGIVLSGALAMFLHDFEVRDYVLGSLALSLSLIGVIGIALLLLPLATSRDFGVVLGLGAFVILALAGGLDYSFIPTVYLGKVLSLESEISISHRSVGELLALSLALSIAGMEIFRLTELRGSRSLPAEVPVGVSSPLRGLYGVFLGLSLQSKRFIAFAVFSGLMALMKLPSLSKGYTHYGPAGLLNSLIFNLSGVPLPLVVLPLGALSISSTVENGTARVLLSKPLRRKDFFLGTLLSDVVAVFLGTALYAGVLIAYAVHLGGGRRAVEIGLVFGVLLFLSLLYYLALGYLLSTLTGGRKALLTSILLAFLLDFAVPIAFMAVFGRSEEFARKALYFPVPEVQHSVLASAVSPKKALPPGPLDSILDYEANLLMLIVPTVLYLVASWLKFKKADLR